jgi:hypothetical protein
VNTQLDTVRVNDPGGYEYWFQWAEGENGGGIWLLCDSTRGLRPAGAAEVALAAEVERLREALRRIEARRESWYDAMGDDEAGSPNDEAEEAWNIAIEALAGVSE